MEQSRHREGHQTAQVTELGRSGVRCQTRKFKLMEPEQAHRGRALLCQGWLKMEYSGGSVVRTLLSLLRAWVQSLWRTKILQASSTAWPEKKKKIEEWWGREEQDWIFQVEKQRWGTMVLGEQQVPEAKCEKRGRGQLRRWGCPVCRPQSRAESLRRETWAGDGVRGVGGGGRGPRPEPVWAPWGNPENSVLAAKEQGGLRNWELVP